METRLSLLALTSLAASCSGPPATPPGEQARAIQIGDAKDLIGGPKASGRVGDFLLANGKVRFVIAAAGRSRAWFPTGGVLLDADRVRAAGEPDDDRLQEMVTRVGDLRILYADKVEVAADGSDGGNAVVRVTGHDIAVPILQAVRPQPPSNVTAVTEYRLAPDAESLEAVTTVTDQGGADQSLQVGDVFVMADFLTLYAPGYGADKGALMSSRALRYFAGFGGAVSYAYQVPGKTLTPIFPQNEIFALGTLPLHLPAHGTASFSRTFAVGTGDVASLLPEIVRREGGDQKQLVTVAGTVSETGTKRPIAGAQVAFSDGKGPYAIAVTDAMGHYTAPLEAGSYGAVPTAGPVTGASATIVATAGAAPPAGDLQVTATGQVALDLKDAAGGPTPARVQLFTKDGASFDPIFSVDGKGGATLPPGDYRAVVSRGFEWEAATVPFTVTAGQTATVAATIGRVVDTSGFIAIDSHTHTAISVDSQLDPRVRVAQALADGVELVITTDHDVVFDLAPTVGDMGLSGTFATAVGCEVSPVLGHINGYPAMMSAASDTDGYWAVKWWSEQPSHEFIQDLWPADIFAAVRDKLGADVVQINHPRSSQGVLNWVGYDPNKGLASVDKTQFDTNWDVIEICNAGCDRAPTSADGQALRDYYSFLNQGLRKGAVGVSDEHGTNFLGSARTMVEVHDDDPKTLDPNEVWMSLKSGRGVVMAGAFATATVKDDAGALVGMGQLAKATGKQVTLHVKVQAPSWIATDRITVVVDGAEVTGVPIAKPAGAPPAVRFDDDITFDAPAADAWVMVIVDGDAPMAPVLGAMPRTITNPIYLDRNGDGAFQAPGL